MLTMNTQLDYKLIEDRKGSFYCTVSTVKCGKLFNLLRPQYLSGKYFINT